MKIVEISDESWRGERDWVHGWIIIVLRMVHMYLFGYVCDNQVYERCLGWQNARQEERRRIMGTLNRDMFCQTLWVWPRRPHMKHGVKLQDFHAFCSNCCFCLEYIMSHPYDHLETSPDIAVLLLCTGYGKSTAKDRFLFSLFVVHGERKNYNKRLNLLSCFLLFIGYGKKYSRGLDSWVLEDFLKSSQYTRWKHRNICVH
jgi:hypothetical protein